MTCQNEDHDRDTEGVARIKLIALTTDPLYKGYEVCTKHLIDYVQGIFLDQPDNDLRLAFAVEPAS